MSAVDAVRSLPTGEQQGLAIYATHGLADTASTLLAAAAFGSHYEDNPIMASLLADGWGFAVGVKLAFVGAVALAYPRLAETENFPTRAGWVLAGAGLLVALLNVAKVGGFL